MSEAMVAVPVPVSMFLDIHRYASSKKWAADPVAVIQNVLENWLETQEWSDRTFPTPSGGYRWKHLVLPSGTQLRMRYQGRYHYAAIEGDAFVGESQESSPGQFVNNVTGTSRSAWRDLEVKRPTDAEWITAAALRAA